MKRNNLIIILSICFFLITLASATQGSLGFFKKNDCVRLLQSCSDCNYVNISSVIDPSSAQILGESVMTKKGTEFNYTFCQANQTGIYTVNGFGDPDGSVEIFIYDFEVTKEGDKLTPEISTFYIVVLVVLLTFTFIAIFTVIKSEQLWLRVLSFYGAYIFITIINYFLWITTEVHMKAAFYIPIFFKWLFYLQIVILFPLFLATIVWYLWLLVYNKEIKRMLEHGVPENEAWFRQNKKRGII